MGWAAAVVGRARLAVARDQTLGTVLERLAQVHGDRPLVAEAPEPDGPPAVELTSREAADQVARWAAAIAEQTTPGDRVVIATPNSYTVLLLMMAVSRAGAVAVPVNQKMRPAEIDHVISDSGAALVLHDVSDLAARPPLAGAAPVDAGETAAILYTSGTTGTPKGAELSHRSLLGMYGAAALWPAGLRRDEAVVGLPVAHVMGLAVLLALAYGGIPVYFFRHFRPDRVLDAIEQRRSTAFVGVPAMYRLLLDAGAEDRDLRSVRVWGSGADVMPADLARRFKRLGASATLPILGVSIGEATFAEGYGMVELAGGVAARVSPPGFGGGSSVMAPLPGFRLKVVDDEGAEVGHGATGHLLVKGPGVLRRYHGQPGATREILSDDGWLRTGDLARRLPFGMVAFAGRHKDVIKHGGYSVFAVEVERALEQHPAVAEAAAVGVPDERKGEVPAAVVRLRPGASATEQELLEFGRGALADYKAPQQIRILDELPRTGTEKVRKPDLRELFL